MSLTIRQTLIWESSRTYLINFLDKEIFWGDAGKCRFSRNRHVPGGVPTVFVSYPSRCKIPKSLTSTASMMLYFILLSDYFCGLYIYIYMKHYVFKWRKFQLKSPNLFKIFPKSFLYPVFYRRNSTLYVK